MKRASRIYFSMLLIATISLGAIWLYAQRPLKPFVPPDEKTRVAAVGNTSDLSPALQAAYNAKSTAFKPIPAPGKSDWLANHREAGQTFAQFLKRRPNRPDSKRHTLYILPLGKFKATDGEALLEPLREYSELYFGMPTKLLPAENDTEALGITTRVNGDTGKRQLLSLDILDILPKKLPADAFCMLAVTTEDLYPDKDWNFVFGQASLSERVGVFSFARYDPTFFGQAPADDVAKLVLRRSCDVLAHETGHMFGIRHCTHFHCIMNGSNHLDESDAAPMHLGPVCLRKLQHSAKFDPKKRYAKLVTFYGKHGFDEEKAWAEARLEALGSPSKPRRR